jgi:plastocyanin
VRPVFPDDIVSEEKGKRMLRRLLLPLVLVGISLAATAAGNAGTVRSTGLTGEVGPGYSIEVKLNGKDLKTIKAGTYKIKVEDKAAIHDFHLVGPGVSKTTSVPFVGDKTWTITLKPGKYTYKCDPHALMGMKGTFRVTA